MFSGIVEEVGRVADIAPSTEGRRLRILARTVVEDLKPGDSVAVDGVCLTVTALVAGGFEVDVVEATLSRTTLGDWERGRPVNLERALALGSRIGGHLLQGHIDGVGRVVAVTLEGESARLDVIMPKTVADITVLHGSIGINGVSLTVQQLNVPEVARVALIPYTLKHTNLSLLQPGDAVNLEGDLIGRFVAHYLDRRGGGRAA